MEAFSGGRDARVDPIARYIQVLDACARRGVDDQFQAVLPRQGTDGRHRVEQAR